MSRYAGFADVSHIFVKVDEAEAPLSLDGLAWEHVAPCGCTCGIMVAETVDADAAERHMTPNAEIRRRDAAEGFLFRLAPRDLVLDRLGKECKCTPRFGRVKVAIPDGYRWAEASGNRRLHLIALDASEPKEFRNVWAKHVHAGPRDHQNLWGRPWGEVPTCRTCERWAKDNAAVTA